MLELRPSCEHCGRSLPSSLSEAMICSFECTFCATCVEEVLKGICPNCGGDFVQRPTRPKSLLKKYPPSEKIVRKVVDLEAHELRIQSLSHIPPSER